MIDFHNHILPNVDDGSKSLEMSLDMLKHAESQGITNVVNTVHFQHPKVEGKDISLNRIQKEMDELQSELNKNNILIKLHCGAEVFFLPNLLQIKNNPLSTFLHGKYMLVEFPVHQIPDIQKQQLFELKMAGVTPIIAHPERYKQVQDNINLVARWLEAGCLIQVDAGSLLGFLGTKAKETSEIIIKKGWAQLLGSDSHDNKNRNFCLKDCIDYINKFVNYDTSFLVNENPRKILKGEEIFVDINYDESINDIPFFSRIKNKMGLI